MCYYKESFVKNKDKIKAFSGKEMLKEDLNCKEFEVSSSGRSMILLGSIVWKTRPRHRNKCLCQKEKSLKWVSKKEKGKLNPKKVEERDLK